MKGKRSVIPFFLVLSLLLVFVLPSSGDIFHLKDGRILKGKVVEETEDTIVIQMGMRGFQEILKKDIEKRIRELTKKEEYEERRKAIPEGDADSHYKLYEWCTENELFEEAKAELLETVKIYSDHTAARKALGHIQYEGVWMTVEEKEALIKKKEEEKQKAEEEKKRLEEEEKIRKEEAAKKSAEQKTGTAGADEGVPFEPTFGLMKYKDMVIRKEEKKFVDKGLVRNDLGEWVTPEEAKKYEEGYYKVLGRWVSKEEADDFHSTWEDAWEIYTEHYLIRGDVSITHLRNFAIDVERLYRKLCVFFGEEPPINDRFKIFILKDLNEYNNFGQQYATGNYTAFHSSTYGCFYGIDHPDRPGILYFEDHRWARVWCFHIQAHQFLDWLLPDIVTPVILEGIATYFERWSLDAMNLEHQRQSDLAPHKLVPLEDVFEFDTLGPGQFQLQNPMQFQAGALFYFLYKGGGPEYAKKLELFLKTMKKKSNDKTVFRKIFNMKKLQSDFKNYITSG